MTDTITQPRTAVVLGIILALPISVLLFIAKFNLEPFNGFFKNLLEGESERMHVLGLIAIIGMMLLLPVGFVLNAAAIRRSLRAGGTIMAHPLNFLVTLGLLAFIVALVSSFVVDQYPCWMGVPNCD